MVKAPNQQQTRTLCASMPCPTCNFIARKTRLTTKVCWSPRVMKGALLHGTTNLCCVGLLQNSFVLVRALILGTRRRSRGKKKKPLFSRRPRELNDLVSADKRRKRIKNVWEESSLRIIVLYSSRKIFEKAFKRQVGRIKVRLVCAGQDIFCPFLNQVSLSARHMGDGKKQVYDVLRIVKLDLKGDR